MLHYHSNMALLKNAFILKGKETSIIFYSFLDLFFTFRFTDVKITLKLRSCISFYKDNESFKLERKVLEFYVKLLYLLPFQLSWMFVIDNQLCDLVFFREITWLTIFVNILKCLFWMINNGLGNFWMKSTFVLFQNSENYSFVVKMWIRFDNLRSSSVQDTYLLPYLQRYTDEIREFD